MNELRNLTSGAISSAGPVPAAAADCTLPRRWRVWALYTPPACADLTSNNMQQNSLLLLLQLSFGAILRLADSALVEQRT